MSWRPGTRRRFLDRADAGRQLAARLDHVRSDAPVVVGLPRGGVVVAAEVAAALDAPLDVIVVRKLGVPGEPEWAMGAIGEDGVRVVEERVLAAAGVRDDELDAVEARERVELERRAHRYRAGRPRLPLRHRTVVVVDDGVATGATARAACLVARTEGARRVVLGVPVAPAGWERRFADVADECVAVSTPSRFVAVSQAYEDFAQTGDDEVVACLARAGGPA